MRPDLETPRAYTKHRSDVINPEAELPPEGTPWPRLTRPERRAVVRHAVVAGFRVGWVIARHQVGNTSSGGSAQTIRRMFASVLAQHQVRTNNEAQAGDPQPVGVAFAERRHGSQCAWPLWGDDEPAGPASLVCGAATDPLQPYCAGHRQLAWRAGRLQYDRRLSLRDGAA